MPANPLFAAMVEAGARGVAKALECDWERMCETDDFPPHWDGTLFTHQDCRESAEAVLRAALGKLAEVGPTYRMLDVGYPIAPVDGLSDAFIAMIRAHLSDEGKETGR